jgi:hypothetical protein
MALNEVVSQNEEFFEIRGIKCKKWIAGIKNEQGMLDSIWYISSIVDEDINKLIDKHCVINRTPLYAKSINLIGLSEKDKKRILKETDDDFEDAIDDTIDELKRKVNYSVFSGKCVISPIKIENMNNDMEILKRVKELAKI